MSSQVKPIPDGHRTITPHLSIKGAAEAIEFYGRAFGAVETGRMTCPQSGQVMHAELKIGDSRLFLADEFPGCGIASPATVGGTTFTIHLYVEDTDALFNRAVEAGATPAMPPSDMPWGDRY